MEKYRLRIEQDLDVQNPFDNDEGLGLFYSGHIHSRETERHLAGQEPDAVILSVYSHSGEYWSVKGEMPPMMQCPWDMADIAGVWIPNKVLLEELKDLDAKSRRLRCVEFARQAMKTFNQYLAGDVYGFIIEKYKDGEWELIDSCWGIYGYENAKTEGEEYYETIIQRSS